MAVRVDNYYVCWYVVLVTGGITDAGMRLGTVSIAKQHAAGNLDKYPFDTSRFRTGFSIPTSSSLEGMRRL